MEPAERKLESSFGKRFARGLRASARDNGSAYGYSVMITAAFGLLSATESTTGVVNVFAFAGGAIVAFGLVEAVASGGFRHRLQDEPSEVKALGSSLAFLSVGLALTVVLGAGRLLGGLVAWSLGTFLATVVYLGVVGIEMSVAERLKPTPEVKEDSS